MTEITDNLKIWLMQHQPDDFKWGWTDCNTYIVEYVDWLTDSDYISDVRGKYFDARSAFKFTRDYKQLDVGVEEAGFEQVEEYATGDIVTYAKHGFVCGHIVAYDYVHSMDVDYGYMCIPADRIDWTDPEIKIWRHNG
tara:strand:+ start:808 stop:1221 length:414 start_codon:yes stop_codon:yes gene_type:complete